VAKDGIWGKQRVSIPVTLMKRAKRCCIGSFYTVAINQAWVKRWSPLRH